MLKEVQQKPKGLLNQPKSYRIVRFEPDVWTGQILLDEGRIILAKVGNLIIFIFHFFLDLEIRRKEMD